MEPLKPIDYKILFELMKDSHRSDREVGRAAGISQPTVTRRRNLLEKDIIYGTSPSAKHLTTLHASKTQRRRK